MDAACNAYRDDWLLNALDARSDESVEGRTLDAHLASCAACTAWLARRVDQIAALRALTRREAPAVLQESVAVTLVPGSNGFNGEGHPFEARLERRIAALTRHRAPDVLARLVAEELANPKAARVRRFAGDLDRPATPGALARRLDLAGTREAAPRSLRRWTLVSAAAAALLVVGLLLVQNRPAEGRPFSVHYGRPPAPSPLAASLADGWTGGILAAGGSAAVEEGR